MTSEDRLLLSDDGLEARRWRVSFAWYDMWIGVFWDRKRHVLYLCPLPCLLVEWRMS